MAGISNKAAGKLQNKTKYNDKELQSEEFSDGSGLDWYDYTNRFYDNQIGRFFCIDKLASDYPYYTPYQFAGNEVPNAIDLDGLEPMRFLWNHMFGGGSSEPPKKLTPEEKRAQDQARERAMDRTIRNLKEATNLMILASTAFDMPASEGGAASSEETEIVATERMAMAETKSLSQIEINAMNGKNAEKVMVENLAKDGHTSITEQITVKADNGVKTKVDAISKSPKGEIVLSESKASATAPLTKNQKLAHPSIAESGGVVVGKGKGDFPGGTRIPPTEVIIKRPNFRIQ